MLDLKTIRENSDLVKESIKKRKLYFDLDAFLDIDREIIVQMKEIDNFRAYKNSVNKEIHKLWLREKQEKLFEMKNFSKKFSNIEKKIRVMKENFISLHRKIPNLLHPDVPEWKNEKNNIVLKKVWETRKINFKPKDHYDLWEAKDFIDKKRATETSWTRFCYLKWDLVLLQYALINFTFDVLTNENILKNIIKSNKLWVSSKPFTPIIPPLMANYETMDKMWRLHPMDDRYCHPEDKQVLIWSAEHTLGPLHMWETIKEENLPLRYFANTPAFRREAWTYWKDSKWIFRVHQFDKIEMESFTTKESWEEEQKFILAIQEYLIKSLELPYQVIDICSWDIWKPDYRQFDIECFFPWQKKYRETHTSDYMTDFQSSSLNTKVERTSWIKEYVHMNDATAFALWRILACIMENYQNTNGNILIPKVLVPYMWGKEEI